MRHSQSTIVVVVFLASLLLVGCGGRSPSAQATATPGGPGREVTLADDGQTITMRVGERFLLHLGSDYDWAAIPADQEILRRVPNVLTIIGSQGLYEAHKAGRTTLTATGDPTCRQSTPPCATPSRKFEITVEVR